MGVSTGAVLAYGFDLGGDAEWRINESSECGELAVPWFDAESDDDFIEAARRRLLAAVGFTETDWEADGYFKRMWEAEERIGVEFTMYCSDVNSLWILATKVIAFDQDDCAVLDLTALQAEASLSDWDEKLAAALNTLGLTPHQEQPEWLLCAWRG